MKNNKLYPVLVFAATILPLGSGSAAAVDLTWTLQNVRFTDGGTATGSFDTNFGQNTFTLSNINITTSGGNTNSFPPLQYYVDDYSSSLQSLNLATGNLLAGDLYLYFPTSLTDQGGVVNLVTTNSPYAPSSPS